MNTSDYKSFNYLENGENSLDTFLLNSGLHAQEDRELIMESILSWIEQFKKKQHEKTINNN